MPKDEVIGVTVILLSCLYKDREFLRVGYYVNNYLQDFDTEEELINVDNLNFEELNRNILISEPRVTRFNIPW